MKITRTLPQFEKYPVLLMVANDHEALFYCAYEGNIASVATITIPFPSYSDRENFVKGGGDVYFAAGSRFENEHQVMVKALQRDLKKVLPFVIAEHNIKRLVIFAPQHMLKQLQAAITVPFTYPTTVVIGNFSKRHPFNLLKKIKTKSKATHEH